MKKIDSQKNQPIDCFQCKHLYITWEPNNPRGCRAFGFKTKRLPSVVVQETSGEPCHNFSPKKTPPPSKKKGWVA